MRTHPTLSTAGGIACLAGLWIASALAAPAAAGPLVIDPFKDTVGKSNLPVDLQLVADGFVMPLWATNAGDGSGRLFVIDQSGQIHVIKNGKLVAKPALDLSGRMVTLKPGFDERGLLGIAFHPGFADRNSPGYRRVYTYCSEPISSDVAADFALKGVSPDHQSVVAEWQFSASDPDVIDPSTRREVLRFDEPQFNHDGGAIAFGPDGMLYVAVGDGGNAHDIGPGHSPQGNGQDLMKVLGKVLRIDPLGRSGKRKVKGRFSVPNDNPLVGKADALDVIWAWGLRNPFRMSFDRKTGQLIVGDIGQNQVEEVDVIVRGGNYGWHIREASFYFNAQPGHEAEISREPFDDKPKPRMIDPAIQYDHDDGISVIGGFVYRGKALPKLVGQYIFGDWKKREEKAKGRLFHADLKTGKMLELMRSDGSELGEYVTGFGEDEQGELYLLTSNSTGPKGNTGKVYRIAPAK